MGRLPSSATAAQSVNAVNPPADFTYGTSTIFSPGTYVTNNAEVVAILMDLEKYGDGRDTINTGHVKNTQQTKFLDAKMSGDNTRPGVGPDGVYRDPWGNPYIITLDLNGDEKCRDAFYCLQNVSQITAGKPQGHNGLSNPNDPSGAGNFYEFNGTVMVWSIGPDKTATAGPANTDPNKDNVLSWK